ncbi:MAG: Fe-S cluster assembly protein SufD [Candidatus Competibacterales bacterium]|nr:Fe-S cluster assembly protein SufD [Candidatus Competibacterales bacterium]
MAQTATPMPRPFRADFDRLQQARREPGFLRRLREDGMAHFEQLGLPHRKLESWRFTDLSAFAERSFAHAGATPVDAARLPGVLATGGLRLVFVNGRYNPALSESSPLPEGIVVCSLGEALERHPARLEAELGHTAGPADHAFAALNDALLDDGVYIHVAAGKHLEAPVELVHYTTGEGTASYPRNLVVLDEAAQISVVEDHRGQGEYFACPQTEIRLGPGAVCRYHKLQQEAAGAWHLGTLRLQQARDSQFSAHLLSAGGRLNRTDILARLEGEGADCGLHGLTLVEDGELADYHVRVEHAQPHGSSRQLFRSVLNGRSRAVFDGLIKVVEQAQKTDASQTCRNLLLSPRALAHANPRLEILADDVKCAHGATVGFLDRDALFYLRSRGVGAAEARAMLVFAFANELFETLTVPALRERLEALLVERYYPAGL